MLVAFLFMSDNASGSVVNLAMIAGLGVGAYFLAKNILGNDIPTPPSENATVEYITNPAGIVAEMFIDGISVGFTNNPNILVVEVTPGPHTFSFGEVTGYVAPSPLTFTIEAGASYTATVVYVENIGALMVYTTPVLGQVSIDGILVGVAPVYKEVPPGPHVLSFGMVSGYTAPPNLTVDVIAGKQHDITATYVPVSPTGGVLSIVTTPIQGRIYVNGADKGLSPVNVEVPVGLHTVSFGEISGYATPPDQQVSIADGETKNIVGEYVTGLGNLQVDTIPIKGEVFVNGASKGMAPIEMSGISVGDYNISFGDMIDHDTPPLVVATVQPGLTTVVTAEYISWGPTFVQISGIYVYEHHL